MSRGRVGVPYRFPTLRDTAEWERQEKRRRRIIAALMIIATLAVLAIGGCNGAHGRC
ncbi:hypothetical protein UFOVP529_50 [uncultured Caudovirales phage]|uniref:Uncharacterized protein n=1 Tax=uncultured Caudovirales phage TaxID=2100421 RepID=A0A6J5MQQ8_9CAUD|nr:hypothetical protein UFOVP529_50 [uncultured Caudovirales phage]CAB4190753.1 hypothetical protein UFOVP1191_108 [uncultured Caudovirales phage]